MVWREQKDHITDCYFYLTKIEGYHLKQITNKSMAYSNLSSAILSVPHFAKFLISKPLFNLGVISDELAEYSEDSNTDFDPFMSERRPLLITQKDLNDLLRVLNLFKDKSKLIALRLQEKTFATTKQWSKELKEEVSIPQLLMIKTHKLMEVVHHYNRLLKNRSCNKREKWYRCLVTRMIDMAVVNACIIYRLIHGPNSISTKGF